MSGAQLGYPNVVAVHGAFKYLGNVRGINQYGGPCMIESYGVPDTATRKAQDARASIQRDARAAATKEMKHKYRVTQIAHYLKMVNNATSDAMSPIQDDGLTAWIELLGLYNAELASGPANPELIRANIGITEARIRSRLIAWKNVHTVWNGDLDPEDHSDPTSDGPTGRRLGV